MSQVVRLRVPEMSVTVCLLIFTRAGLLQRWLITLDLKKSVGDTKVYCSIVVFLRNNSAENVCVVREGWTVVLVTRLKSDREERNNACVWRD